MKCSRFKCLMVIFIILLTVLPKLMSQTVTYIHKPLAAEGCTVEYTLSKQNNDYYIIATVKSDRLIFSKDSYFWLKTVDDDIIKLEGTSIISNSESGGVLIGNIVVPVTDLISTAQFKITEKDLELLKKGVIKVRLSTIPFEHEKTFKKDKIGKMLYKFYQKKKSQNDDF